MYSCKNIKIPFLTPESFEFSCEFYFHYIVKPVKNKYTLLLLKLLKNMTKLYWTVEHHEIYSK